MTEDMLTASRNHLDNWSFMMVQALCGPALTWYFTQKKASQNQPPTWDELKKAMLEHWDNLGQMMELWMHLDQLMQKDYVVKNIAKYVASSKKLRCRFQSK